MNYYFFKLIPPRGNFHQSMSEDETKIMKKHGVYWKELQDKGIAPVFGPVLDPKGVWGLGIIEIRSENEAFELTKCDPAITSGLCTIEIYPMHAVVKK